MTFSKLLDNSSSEFSMRGRLSDLLKSKKYSELSIATGYWDLPSLVDLFDELSKFLSSPENSIRLLIGEEPSVASYQVKSREVQNPAFPQRFIKKDLEDLELTPEYRKAAELITKYSSEKNTAPQFQIRIYRKNFLHAKCYILGTEKENAVGILGSSNFTRQGLSGNLELNHFESDNSTVNFIPKSAAQHPSHRSWFENLWQEAEDWTGQFRQELIELSKHGDTCFSPYEMYIHALYRIYKQELEDELNDVVFNDAPDKFPQLERFQLQNANSLIKKLERQGVAMLSDSVGFGKTYTAIKVIDYYKNHRDQGVRVVVICPAGLKPQWLSSFNDFGLIPPEILSMQDVNQIEMTKSTLRNIPVGLFVFDESHNLRSAGGRRFEAFLKWRMENPHAKTLLVTATPINNQMTDLFNQVQLALGGDVLNLGRFYDRNRQKYDTIEERLNLIRADIQKQIRLGKKVDFEKIREQLRPMLNRFIVRRTRQGIEKEYPEGLLINGKLQKFPIATPLNLEYKLQNEFKNDLLNYASGSAQLTSAYEYEVQGILEQDYLMHPLSALDKGIRREKKIQSSLEIVYTGILALGFPCYRYNIYQWRYYGKKLSDLKLNAEDNREISRQTGIYGIFRTIFLKRMESSLHSLWLSLNNYESKLMRFETTLKSHNKIVSVKDINRLNEIIECYNEQAADEDELDINLIDFSEENINMIEADKGVYRVDLLLADIEKDLEIIRILRKQVEKLIEHDNKLVQLADKLDELAGKKVLIFTYFADTMTYLRDKLPELLRKKRNIEFAIGSKYEIENYACRFAPVAKKYELKEGEAEINVLVATDKLSEGQNLQDCGIIINFDLHWNPVRMIQRNGRINRLGSIFDEIFIYNFRPTEQLESYLQLVNKLQSKIDLIRYTIGSDQSVLDEEPMPQDFTEDLYSRDEKKRIAALKRIQETSELIGAEDLFMDNLREFYRNESYTDEYKQSIFEMPKGKWGNITSPKPEDEFSHMAHFSSNSDDGGYFVTMKDDGTTEMLSTEEGLLYIQAASADNERFTDKFKGKPAQERLFTNLIENGETFNMRADRYNENQINAINTLIQRMEENGVPESDIQKVYDTIYQTENSYVKKQMVNLVRELTRKIRNHQGVRSELLDRFIEVASLTDLPVDNEPPVLNEVIQIFAR